jgi:chloramphenicol-sensitive protein RarD
MNTEENNTKKGLVFTIQAFLFWGVLPIFWKLLSHVPSEEVLAHRIFWAFVFLILLLWVNKKLKIKALFKNRKLLASLVITSVLIGINWGLFVYAVNTNQILEASFGYFINPLVSVLLGITILKEKLSPLKIAALLLAVCAVIYMTIDFGKLPWISLGLAFAFGLYGLLKKTAPISSLQGLAIETLFLAPFCLSFIIYKMISGTGMLFTHSFYTDILFVSSGVVTVLPLFWFAKGAKRIPLSTVGILQYITPSIMLLLGVFIYGEEFGATRLISFSIIWVALAIYTYSLLADRRKKQLKVL